MAGELLSPTLDQILDFCAEDPIERVFLEDVARRGLGRFVASRRTAGSSRCAIVGVNAVPSGRDCGAFARDVARAGPRMLIGESRAVGELWDEARARGCRRRARTVPGSRCS